MFPTTSRHWLLLLGLMSPSLCGGCSTPAKPSCTYTLSRTAVSFPPAGGSESVSVTTSGASCSWSAASDSGWLSVAAGTQGTGNGTVTVNAAANGGAPRNATVSIAGQSVAVSQTAYTFSLSGTVADVFVGFPLGGVSVAAAGGPSQGAAVTDSGGNYTISGLVPGNYTVTFSTRSYVTTTKAVSIAGATTLAATMSLDVPTPPSTSNLTGYWSGSGVNGPFKLALVQSGTTLQVRPGYFRDGSYNPPNIVLDEDFGDGHLYYYGTVDGPRSISGEQQWNMTGTRYRFTMSRN